MSRTPAHDEDAIDRDVQYLMKIKRRVTSDPKSGDSERKKLEDLLVQTITLLLNGKNETSGAKKK